MNYTKKGKRNLNGNVGSLLGHLGFKLQRVFNVIQEYIMQYFYFTFKNFKAFFTS